MSKNLSELAGRQGVEKSLFEDLGVISRNEGSPSKDQLQELADKFLVGLSTTYGTATFYDFMKPENKGKKVYVCNGSACLCSGKQDAVTETLKTHFKADEIGHMTCLGRCHENGAFNFNGKNYSAKSADEIAKIVSSSSGTIDEYNVQSKGTVILTSTFSSTDDYYKNLSETLKKGRQAALDEIKASNIRGRGGAGFPMGFKLESCMNTTSDQKFIICNADEGDPGAYSDRYLLEKQPHSVLYGMMIAGFITGANWGLLYIRAEYPESVETVQTAINELHDKKLLGENILGSGFNFNFKIIKAQGAYICGEETALINSIEGQRPEVRTRPPYPTLNGLFNKPTVVNNVETLAAVHWILENGGSKYKALGTEKSSGTKLVSLDSFFNKPGIYEVEMGTPLSVVFNELGGGFKSPIKAMQIGGPLGGIVPASKINELSLDFESFANAGFLLGHASVVCIPESFPMIDYIEHLFDFASFESCGKCFPCRLGTKRGHEMFKNANEGKSKLNRELVEDLLHTLETGSLCAHGGGIPLPVKNALTYFESELKPYFG
ncbi:MAG: NADH-ubiquinone oxidoreductase-F iron-sulfur binding region domain-containing protein [Crocinitomicaceae bacterium]|nr:NAD(P)H-dependent oxidoreductase subunit E [Crocinitomicaceae bacterium]